MPMDASNSEEDTVAKNEQGRDCDESDEENETPQDRLQKLSQLYMRENIVQAVSYVGVPFLTYSFYFKASGINHSLLDAAVIFFLPLGGFLNILVYTRPMVAELRRRYPECSRIYGFWLVLSEGGKIPDDVDLSLSCCQACCGLPIEYVSDYDYDTTTNRHALSVHTTSFWTRFARLE